MNFLINILGEPARRFLFMDTNDNMSSHDMVDMMMSEHNSDARQRQVQSRIKSLSPTEQMRDGEGTEDKEGVNSLLNTIQNLTAVSVNSVPNEGRADARGRWTSFSVS